MILKYKKCGFGQSSLKFPGDIRNADSAHADPKHIDGTLKLPDPVAKTQLQSLLGSTNQLGTLSLKITDLTLPVKLCSAKTPRGCGILHNIKLL